MSSHHPIAPASAAQAARRRPLGYDPIAHVGDEQQVQKRTGLRPPARTAATVAHLCGAGALPRDESGAAGASGGGSGSGKTAHGAAASGAARQAPRLAAKVDHLGGTACLPHASGTPRRHGSGTDGGPNHKPAAVNLRASVDHLSGGACAVRHVVAQATLEQAAPVAARGMATAHTKGAMVAQKMADAMWGSMVFGSSK